jgi:rhamnogalacturonan endolyase
MIKNLLFRGGICAAFAVVTAVGAEGPPAKTLLSDDYSALTVGMISGGVIGARTEYHYLSATAPRGNWVVSAFRTDASQRAWRLIEEGGRRVMWQSYTESDRERPYTHPLIIAGDEYWNDYTMEVSFAPEAGEFQSGVVFRYRNDRHYYFAGIANGRALLKKVDGGVAFRQMNQPVLADAPFAAKPGEWIALKITAVGNHLTAEFNGTVRLEARDDTFPRGKIGFTSDLPTKFSPVQVTASPEAYAKFAADRKARDDEEAALQEANPKMVLWKKIYTPGFGAGRDLRFGDLDGDGKIDILVVQQNPHGPADSFSEVGCMTAMTLDGKILWQNGLRDSWHDQLTNDVAVQINDIDGDGHNEVIYCRDQEIVVADGATGKTKYKAPTPEASVVGGRSRFPRILGDALYFCDLRGTGARRDLIIKDRYQNVWAYDDKLQPMWHVPLNTGHYPFAYDMDGDGKDELAIGYALLSHDGKVIWNLEDKIQDHADGVAIVRFKDGAEPRWLCAASDEGFLLGDAKGGIIEHLQLGHVQNPSIANYRPDLPGLETVTVDFWGNQGIVNFFDADGKWLMDAEPAQHGSMMLPLTWKGDGQEYWILSPNPVEGGAFDGWGRRVLKFPADGHPDMCVATLDLTGDCRDEIVVWDPWEIWIYTASDSPKKGRLYKPTRNVLCNESNYKTSVSLPGWSE